MSIKLAYALICAGIIVLLPGCAGTFRYLPEEEIPLAKEAMAEKNFVTAKHHLEHVQEYGIREVDLLLGLVDAELGDHLEAIPLLRPFAEEGIERTYGPIGWAYERQSNYAEAEKWLRMASDLGDPKAKILLAIGQGEGWIQPSDRVAAFKLLNDAATDTEYSEIAENARNRVAFEFEMRGGPKRSQIPKAGCIVYFARSIKFKQSIEIWCSDEADPVLSDKAKLALETHVENNVGGSVGQWLKAEYVVTDGETFLNGMAYSAVNERWIFTFSEGQPFYSYAGSGPIRVNE